MPELITVMPNPFGLKYYTIRSKHAKTSRSLVAKIAAKNKTQAWNKFRTQYFGQSALKPARADWKIEEGSALPNPRKRKMKRRKHRRHARRVKRNFKLRIKLKGKLRTYKSVIKKLGRKKGKSAWRKSRKYHGRKLVTCPPCRRKRKGHRRGRRSKR